MNARTTPVKTSPSQGLGQPPLNSATSGAVHPSSDSELRTRAEAALRAKVASLPERSKANSPDSYQKLMHELCVQQIELDMQSDELRRAKEELEASRSHAVDLYDFAPVAYVSLSEAGLVLEANRTADNRLGGRGALLNQPLDRFIAQDDRDAFNNLRNRLLATGEPQTCELRLVPAGGPPFWVHLAASTTPALITSPGSRDDFPPRIERY